MATLQSTDVGYLETQLAHHREIAARSDVPVRVREAAIRSAARVSARIAEQVEAWRAEARMADQQETDVHTLIIEKSHARCSKCVWRIEGHGWRRDAERAFEVAHRPITEADLAEVRRVQAEVVAAIEAEAAPCADCGEAHGDDYTCLSESYVLTVGGPEARQVTAGTDVEVIEAPRPVGNAKTGVYKLTDRMKRALVATVQHSPSGVMVSCPGDIGKALVRRGLASVERYHFMITDEGRAEAERIMQRKAELSAENAESDARLARDLAAIAQRIEAPAMCDTCGSDLPADHVDGKECPYGLPTESDVAGLQVSAEVYVSEHGHGVTVRKLGSKRKPSKRHGGRRGGRR